MSDTTRQQGDALPLRPLRSDLESVSLPESHDKAESEDGDDLLEEHDRLMGNGFSEKPSGDTDEGDSPAEQVRKVVPETDYPSLPTLTLRVIFLGVAFAVLGGSISQLMFFKSNPVVFSPYFVILATLPLGRLMAKYLPTGPIRIMGLQTSLTLNPGPFSVKEHVLIAVIAGSGSTSAYAGDVLVIQDLFYHTDLGVFGGLLLILTTQMIGFALAGTVYNLLVRPTVMVWPSQLVTVTLFNTLHGDGRELTRKRLRFFAIAFAVCFVWQFFPTVLAPLLTSLAVLCVFGGGSQVARVLGSGYHGFGLLNISLDWSVISSAGSLYTPFWASCNFYAGLVLECWILGPIIYYLFNFWDSQSFDDTIGTTLYDRSFNHFNISSVITPQLTLDERAYDEHGPILLTPFFAYTYGVCFAVLTAAIVHVILHHHQTIRDAFAARTQSSDVHVQILERNYEGVPWQWYTGIGAVTLGGSIFVCLFYPIQLPVWGLGLAIALSIFFLVPCGIITATTNTTIGLNVISELIAGFLLPGRPIGNVVFKAWGYMTMSQALGLVGDLKLALYSKIPPKHMFICQALGTAVGSVVNFWTLKRVIADKRPYLDGTLVDPTGQWTGRSPRIFYSASVIWGLIGPARFFSGKYGVLYWGFAIGAVLPLIPWYIGRRRPDLKKRFHLDYVSFPLVLHGGLTIPQYPTNIIFMGFLSAWLSMRYALQKHPEWHQKYNYVLSSALDAATSVQALVIYVLGIATLPSAFWNSPIDTELCRRAQ